MSTEKDAGFNQLLNHAAINYTDSMDEKNKSAEFKLTLAIVGILFFVGYEAIKILFRTNFGMSKSAMIRLALCFLSFSGIAAISFSCINSTDNFATESGTPDTHLVMGIIYSVLAVTLLIKSIAYRNKQNDESEGDGGLLSFLMKKPNQKEGWEQSSVQNIAEPLLAIAIGTAFCFVDLLGGIPIVFCAISAWANVLFGQMFKNHSLQQKVNKLNTDSKPKSNFYEINTD